MKKLLSVIFASAILASCAAQGEALDTSPAAPPQNVFGTSAPTGGTENVQTGVESTEAAAPEKASFATYSGKESDGTLKYTTHSGKTLDDFSFLNGLSRNFFSDTDKSDPTGSWYCGKTERDEKTGEVRVIFDRAADTLATLERYGTVYRKNEDEKVIYLTFDCGYDNGYTAPILDILKEKNVSAAFFLNGQFIKTAPDLIERMLDEGHVVGNHGANHATMSKLSVEELFYEVESNNELLRSAVPDAPYMTYFRPPAGSCSEWDLALYREMELECVLYSWAYYDYAVDAQPSADSALRQMKAGLHNGEVMMLHCVGETNVQVLGEFIDWARAEGYRIGDIREK